MSSRTTEDAAATEALGAELAARLEPGDVVLVAGEVGAGKTTLIRGACRELGVREPVVSPTFTIGRRYRGRIAISHLDLYRLAEAGIADEEPGLIDDYLTADAVAFIEWPEVASGEPAVEPAQGTWRVLLRHAGGDRREIEIVAPAAPREPGASASG